MILKKIFWQISFLFFTIKSVYLQSSQTCEDNCCNSFFSNCSLTNNLENEDFCNGKIKNSLF